MCLWLLYDFLAIHVLCTDSCLSVKTFKCFGHFEIKYSEIRIFEMVTSSVAESVTIMHTLFKAQRDFMRTSINNINNSSSRQAGRQEKRFAHTQKRSDVNVSTMQTAFDSVLLSFQLHTNFHKVRARSIMHENKTKQWDSLSFFSCKWHNKSALLLSHRVFFIIHFSVLHFIFNRVVFAESGTYSNPFKYTMDICALRLVPTSAWHKYATWNVYGDKSQTNSNPE